jgi:hypothetical protein
MYTDVAHRRHLFLEEIEVYRSSFQHNASYNLSSVSLSEEVSSKNSLGAALFNKMKQLMQITSELCTGREQLMKAAPIVEIYDYSSISNDMYGHQSLCVQHFNDNIQLTKALMLEHTAAFGSLGIEVLAEAQNCRIEMLLGCHATRYSDPGSADDSDRDTVRDRKGEGEGGRERESSGSVQDSANAIVNAGREMLMTLQALLPLSREETVQLNDRSVMYRIAATNYNLAMFCLGADKVNVGLAFSREGLSVSESFVSAEFPTLHKYISMHASLLSAHAHCLHLSGSREDAMGVSALAIRYATSLYKTVYTEKNVYCGELFDHYLKRLYIVESDGEELKYIAYNLALLSQECQIELNAFQKHFVESFYAR